MFFCPGCALGIGVIAMLKSIVAPMRIGSTWMCAPMSGIVASSSPGIRSGIERSEIQRKPCRRSSAQVWNAQYMPKKIGIEMSTGKQPASGLILFSRYSFIISCCIFCGLSLYFSRISFIGPLNCCIFFAERCCAAVSGQVTPFTISVITRIAQPHDHSLAGSRS